jgi:hypothetical protein
MQLMAAGVVKKMQTLSADIYFVSHPFLPCHSTHAIHSKEILMNHDTCYSCLVLCRPEWLIPESTLFIRFFSLTTLEGEHDADFNLFIILVDNVPDKNSNRQARVLKSNEPFNQYYRSDCEL